MAEAQPAPDLALLSVCAILKSFDRDLLLALADDAEHDVESLLSSDLLVPAVNGDGIYQLRADVQGAVEGRLRVERPRDEIAIHTRVFYYFLGRIQESAPSERTLIDEDRCFAHLDMLREMLTEHREWRTIARHVAAARTIAPQRARHRHLLALYEGFVAIRLQDYARGERILSDLVAQPDLADDVRVRVLHALGIAHWVQTRYGRALAYCQQFHDLARVIGDLVYQGGGLINMGLIYFETGYYEQSFDLFVQSLDLFRQVGDRYREARALWHVGLSAMYLGRWNVAQSHFDAAIDLYESLGVQASLANLYWCRGSLYHIFGDEHASEVTYRRALEIAQSPEHGHLKVALDTYLYLGLLYQTQERWTEALTAYDNALLLAEQLNNQHLLALTLYGRGNVLERQQQPDAALAAYREAITIIETLRGATEDETIKIGFLGTTQQVFESMVLLCLSCDRPVEAFEYVERARSQAFLDTLTRKSPELYDAVDQPIVTLPEVQSRLPADALLIEYFTTGVVPRGEHLLNKLPAANVRLRQHLSLPPQVIFFSITHDHCEVHHAPVDPNTLRPLPNDPGPGRRLLRGRILPLLYERLIEPVEHLMQGRDLLYVIPHGPLHYVPFQAMRSASGTYLIDRLMLARAPSATILLRNCLGRKPGRASRLIALGYNDIGEAALFHAEAEARSVAQLTGGESWTGSAPKSPALLAIGREIRWLHFAGHAVFKPLDPLASELRLGIDDALSARTIIGELDLGADLVTLSACTSGLTQVVSGDELLGLQRAFLYAGTPTVVCTLWEANDLVTRFVMERFYTDLQQGRPAAAALRDAQVFVRDLTGAAAAEIVRRWREEQSADAAMLDELLRLLAEQPDAQPFADPICWAPFMLIGRPS